MTHEDADVSLTNATGLPTESVHHSFIRPRGMHVLSLTDASLTNASGLPTESVHHSFIQPREMPVFTQLLLGILRMTLVYLPTYQVNLT